MNNSILFLQKKLTVRFLLDIKRFNIRDHAFRAFFARRRRVFFFKSYFCELSKYMLRFKNIGSSDIFKQFVLPSRLFYDCTSDVPLLSLNFLCEKKHSLHRFDNCRNLLSYSKLFNFVSHLEFRYSRFSSDICNSFHLKRRLRLFKWANILFFWLIVLFNDLFLISFKSMLLFWFHYVSSATKFSHLLYKSNKFLYFFDIDLLEHILPLNRYIFNNVRVLFYPTRLFLKYRNFYFFYFSINARAASAIAPYKILFFPRFLKISIAKKPRKSNRKKQHNCHWYI